MTGVINLRQARKRRDRAERRATGDANAAKFGEPKPLRAAREAEALRSTRAHQAHLLERDPAGKTDD